MEQDPFDAPVTLEGPERKPRQMLAEQTYGGHSSLHDDATADSLGLSGAPIEGPTHFSQFDPLAHLLWGPHSTSAGHSSVTRASCSSWTSCPSATAPAP